MHWADVAAERLSQREEERHIIASGITPSGEFHIGHLREILTGDMITRACKERGMDVEFVFIVDTMDPLRKVYPFLSDGYEQYIGHPLARIPAPDENGHPNSEGGSYADYFLRPFLKALERIGVNPRLIDNHDSYCEGKFAEKSKIACEKAAEIREIIESISNRELSDDWFPFNPIGHDGSMDNLIVTGYEWPYVHWEQNGEPGKSDIREGEGKLPWRVDWPAKWGWIGVTCEPFGKDHGAAGGSYETGRVISELFSDIPPMPLTYEWISLKGKGAMSSSSGNTIGPLDALELVPPEVLRYLIARAKPSKAIDFDAGMGLVDLADEYDRLLARDLDSELNDDDLSRRQKVALESALGALRMSRISESEKGESVTFRHLALVAQIREDDEDVFATLGVNRSSSLELRLRLMRNWIHSEHFPEEMRIRVLEQPDTEACATLESEHWECIDALIKGFSEIDWNTEAIGACIGESSRAAGHGPRQAFRALYLTLMAKERGPRLAPVLAAMEREDILNRLQASLELR